MKMLSLMVEHPRRGRFYHQNTQWEGGSSGTSC